MINFKILFLVFLVLLLFFLVLLVLKKDKKDNKDKKDKKDNKDNKEIYKYEKINPKFFKETNFSNHLDIRYGKKNISIEKNKSTLIYLLKMFSKYCEEKNIKLIIMHGSLIGYYFNKKILPWDDDIDIILIEDDSYKLKNYNGYDYIIEVNPNSINRSKKDINNVIDARVISKINGIFIDITYFFGKDILCAKDTHCYKSEYILPLTKTIFENIDVWVPNDIKNCLVKEYGQKVLKNTFEKWVFNENTKEWIINDKYLIKEYCQKFYKSFEIEECV